MFHLSRHDVNPNEKADLSLDALAHGSVREHVGDLYQARPDRSIPLRVEGEGGIQSGSIPVPPAGHKNPG